MKKTNNTPEVRFAGFEDEWVKKKFDDVFDMLSNNTLSRDALNSESGVAKNIHYGDVLTKFGEYINVGSTKLPFISDPAIATKFVRSYLKDGDVVIADTAEDETVGKCTEVIGVEETPVIAGLHTMPCRPKEKYAPKYMGYYLNSNAYHDNLFPLMQGVKVTSISRTGVKETEVILSTEFDEQEKIGEHLSSLDDMIALETAKYEKLAIIKKAMLEKMFPKEGCDVPELRFGGFTDAWEQRKIGELFFERCESMPNGELLSVTTNEGIKKFSEIGRHDNSNDDKSKYKRVCIGDIAYNSMRMWQGASGYSPYDGIVSPAYTVLAPNGDVHSKCVAYLFKRPDTVQTFRTHSQGITSDNWNLKFPALSEIKIMLANSIDEQICIANYLQYIDNIIKLQQQKVEKLKNIKYACMEKMFV